MYRPEDIGDSSYVRCGFRDCYQCCLETEMIITEEEANIIEKNTGFMREDYLLDLREMEGYFQLRNVPSKLGMKCIFLSDKGKCTIYKFAPKGCKMYPLILNLDTDEAMIDIDCREEDWFAKQTYYDGQITSIKHLVRTLIAEAEMRVELMGLYPSDADIKAFYFDDSEGSQELRELMERHKEDEEEEERKRRRDSLTE